MAARTERFAAWLLASALLAPTLTASAHYILKHRMCVHFQKDAAAGDSSTRATGKNMAKSLCPGADAATWKKLVRKYEGQDPIPGILLAERPAGIEMDTGKSK